jgi:hypothetical protein
MKRRSASVAVVEAPKKTRLTLRKHKVEARDEANVIAAVIQEGSTLVREEKVWLHGRLVVGLEKSRSVLAVIKDDSLADDKVFEEISDKQSLGEVLAALNGNNRRKIMEKKVLRLRCSGFCSAMKSGLNWKSRMKPLKIVMKES